MIQNGFEIATRNNFTDDPDFLGCVGCAVMRRKQEQLGLEWPSECEQCFQRYCWNGTIAQSRNSSSDSTPDTKNDVLPETVDVSSIVINQCTGDDCYNTIHTATSTTVTCHECEKSKAAPSALFTTTTVECEECQEGNAQATSTVECEECEEEVQNGKHKYTTVTSLSTTTEFCEFCEEAQATTTAGKYSNGSNDNENGSNGSNSHAIGSNTSNNIIKSSTSSPTILLVTTGVPTYSVMSVVLNENIGNSIELKGFATVVALMAAMIGIF